MKQFFCGDVVPGCDKVFAFDDVDELLSDVAVHAREAHGMTDIPPDVVDDVRRKAHRAT